MAEYSYRLPGGKARVDSRGRQRRAFVKGLTLFGPRYVSLLVAASSNDRRRIRVAERSWLRDAAEAAEISIETHGLDWIDTSTQYVVAPLHEGFADVVALSGLPLDLAYSATEELFDWRLLGRYLRATGHGSVSRNDGRAAYREMLRSARAAFEQGESYVVFPQGSILGIEIAFHRGAAHIAKRCNRPLLPIVLTGGGTVWEYPFSRNLSFGQTIRMEVLEPIDPAAAVAEFSRVEATMKQRALAAVPGPRRFQPERDGWWDGYRYGIDPAFIDLAETVADHRALITPPGSTSGESSDI